MNAKEQISFKEIKDRIARNKNYIQNVFHVNEIGLFGSFVKGKQTRKSDIDILIDFDKGHKDFFNYMRLKIYIENFLGREVDLVIKGALKKQLKDNILSEVEYV